MTTNKYFNNNSVGNQNEQQLINDLVKETIQIHGIDVFYIRRIDQNLDPIYIEDPTQQYKNTYVIEMYLNNFAGYVGPSELFSKFGYEIRDEVTLTVSRMRFEQEVASVENIPRPLEGDIIYIPTMDDYFEIKYVDHRKVFYQKGDIYSYEIRCNKFEFSHEVFQTGVDGIDSINQRSLANTSTANVFISSTIDPRAMNDALTNAVQGIVNFDETDPFGGDTE